MKRHWSITTDAKLSVTEQICQKRNIDPAFLHLTLADLPSEKLLANIEAVADRIRTALYRNEPLVIFGHDDPDGITSAYILYRFLETCGYQKHHYYIPNRNLEPHGIQASFLQAVKEGKYPLIITVDNGISALEGVQALNQMGCEVIITDHHLVQPDQIPQAVAILNPQLPESRYPYKMLAGVGVVLMLIRYLSEMLEHKIEPALYFWTAIGSIADKVPMTGVNWILVRHVIEHWDELNDSTIQFLQRNYTRISTKADKMGFMQYCSRLIANGREVGGQHIAMRFMLQLSDEKARLFQLLEEEKNEWESALNGVFKLVDTLLTDYEGDAFIYYDDEDLIPYSLLGTAATYVVNNLDIPVIMLKNRHNMIVCEGRCNSSFNIVEAFTYCKSALIQFGGHAKAAGFTMQHDKYNDFIDLFHEYILAPSSISKQPRYLEIDAVVNWSEVGNGIWSELDKFTPYGQENLEPVIVLQGCTLAQINEKFLIDNNSSHLPTDQLLNVAVQFKNHSTIRILDHRSAGESN